jgi:hypothetical protein
MVPVGYVVEKPGLNSFLQGIARGRLYGATFYLYGLVLIPVVIAAALTGQLHAFAALAERQAIDLWAHWLRTPAWIWTWTLLLSRLVNVVFAVGCVYVTYRIGTTMRDRLTGRLAASLLTVTWGFLVMAHEVGEDIPALLFFLLVVYLGLRYAHTGDETLFLAGCACGGAAIAFKLTAGVSVVLLGVAYLLYVRNAGEEWLDALVRPRLLGFGVILGTVVIVIDYPTIFVDGLDRFIHRILRGTTNKSHSYDWRVKPSWWWILRGYLHSLGVPLFVAVLGGVGASLPRLRERSPATDGIILSIAGSATYLVVYARWSYIRAHHLLPTVPLLIVMLAVSMARLYEHNQSLARPLIAVLLVSSGVFVGVGVLGYASQPRDEATEWLQTHAGTHATVETYVADPQEAAIPHGMNVSRPRYQQMSVTGTPMHPQTYTDWILAMPQRCPTYIELTYHRALLYLAPNNRSLRAKKLSVPRLTEYYRDLLAENTYPYTVVATFGPRPDFLANGEQYTWLPDLLRVGIFPRTIQYGDPQDFGIDQYTVILQRTGRCQPAQVPSPSASSTTPRRKQPGTHRCNHLSGPSHQSRGRLAPVLAQRGSGGRLPPVVAPGRRL